VLSDLLALLALLRLAALLGLVGLVFLLVPSQQLYSPTPASAKTTIAFTSSSHLMRKPPLSDSHSLKMF
jgi:hypothetical protein